MKLEVDSIQASSYTVSTQVYEGPLDLLLQIIERAELDITKLALAEVTDQFLAYIKVIEDRLPEQVSEFLVIASRLMQIKSEVLLPRPVEREPGEEDPGEELVRQLLVYKRYKELAELLAERGESRLKTFLRTAPPPKIQGKLDLSGVTLKDLLEAAQIAFSITKERAPLGDVVTMPKVTIREKLNLITARIRQAGKSTFSALLGDQYTRIDVVVTFLAMLELVKRYHIKANQDKLFGEIDIEKSDEWNDSIDFELEFLDF
jgi:segregation and condensation protein A